MKEPQMRFKLYKAKTKWLVAGITALSIMGMSMTVHADTPVENGTSQEISEGTKNPVTTGQSVSTVTLKTPATEQTSAEKAAATTPVATTQGAKQTATSTGNTDTTVPATVEESVPAQKQAAAAATTDKAVTTDSVASQSHVATPTNQGQKMAMTTSATRQSRAMVSTAVTATPASTTSTETAAPVSAAVVTQDGLVYDNAPIDEWMPNKGMQEALLAIFQNDRWSARNYYFLDADYDSKPGAKVWNSLSDITKSDMLLLKGFALQTSFSTHIDGKSSYSIEGLQYATNLQQLDLLNTLNATQNGRVPGYYHGDITDLSPIKNLTNLTWLQIANNRISDLSPLANMKKLTYLSAVNNEISDFSMLDAAQFTSGLTIFDQVIPREPVYLRPGQDTITLNNLGLKLPQNYNAKVGHYAEVSWSGIDGNDYWSYYSQSPLLINVYRRGANGEAVSDTQVKYTIVKKQVTPGPTTSSASGDGVGVHQQPYTYYLAASYYDGSNNKIATYYTPYLTDVAAAANVTVHYQDQEGKAIASDTILNDGLVGQTYTTTPKVLTGYTLDQTHLPSNATGTFGDEPISVTYVYDQMDGAPVTVTYVDDAGESLIEAKTLTGKYGDHYTAQAKTITGYDLKTVQGNQQGTFTDQPQSVTFVYTKQAVVIPPVTTMVTVIVHYQTANGTPLALDKVITGAQGDTYQTSPVSVNGYQLAETPANASGVFNNDDTIIYVYAKNPKTTTGGAGDQGTVDNQPSNPSNRPGNLEKRSTQPEKQLDKKGNHSAADQVTQIKTARGSQAARVSEVATTTKLTKSVAEQSTTKMSLPQTNEASISSKWGIALLVAVVSWFGLKRKSLEN